VFYQYLGGASMNQHIMIDLETLGRRPGSVVVEVGMVGFTAGNPCEWARVFRIDIQSCLNHGMKVDADTLVWWMEQSDEARRTVFSDSTGFDPRPLAVHLKTAAHDIHDLLSGFEGAFVWGNGAGFDLPILSELLHRAHVETPWHYPKERCYRTVNGLFPNVAFFPRDGVLHSALADARYQAARLVQLNELAPAILG